MLSHVFPLLVLAVGPMDRPAVSDCPTQVLQLGLQDLVTFGTVGQRVLQQRCGAHNDDAMLHWQTGRETVVGRVDVPNSITLNLPMRLSLNLVMFTDGRERWMPRDDHNFQVDALKFEPNVLIPEEWRDRLDPANGPVMIVGAASFVGEMMRALVAGR